MKMNRKLIPGKNKGKPRFSVCDHERNLNPKLICKKSYDTNRTIFSKRN